MMGEAALLEWLRRQAAPRDPSVAVGSSADDCAHLVLDGRWLAASVDTFLEGTHFTADAPPEAVGWKAMAASLSDLAASACRARWALAGAGLRRGAGESWARGLAQGLLAAARRYGVDLVGGDTTTGEGPASVTVTVLGEPLAERPLLRSGGRPGDVLVVTGRLGGSLLGRHLAPEPRLAEIARLCALDAAALRAGMDLSDGLALDLSRLIRESGCGAELDADAVPLADAARRMAETDGKSPLAHALADGEDFELLLAVAPEAWPRLAAAYAEEPGLAPLTAVGRLVPEGLWLKDASGRRPLAPDGYEHGFCAG
jgi:thiamine-monophosphate kinase